MTVYEHIMVGANLALAGGLYLGGHPGGLPSWVRTTFVEGDRGVRDQLIHTIQDSYYKKISRSQLDQASLKGIVSSLHDPFSHYFTPAEAKALTVWIPSPSPVRALSIRPGDSSLRAMSSSFPSSSRLSAFRDSFRWPRTIGAAPR